MTAERVDSAAIREDIGDCTRCKLCTLGRKQIVFGVGNPNADLMFVGEAPGRDEDIQGIPFVGRAGQKLTQIIEAIGLTRDDVYIANVIKCRPPENRNPEPDEVATVRAVPVPAGRYDQAEGDRGARHVRREVAPEDRPTPISRLRGRVYDYRGAKLVPTFHPGVSAAQPELPARGVGGHEEGPRPPQRRRRGLIRCGWSPSPFPFPFSTC